MGKVPVSTRISVEPHHCGDHHTGVAGDGHMGLDFAAVCAHNGGEEIFVSNIDILGTRSLGLHFPVEMNGLTQTRKYRK